MISAALRDTASLHELPLTYYSATSKLDGYPSLEGRLDVDIAIVGGGFTGVNTALELAERGYSVAVLESRLIGWGASGRNGGELIRGVGLELGPIRNKLGSVMADQLVHLGWDAVDMVGQRIERLNIDCDLHWGYADLALTNKHINSLQHEMEALQKMGYPHKLEMLHGAELRRVVDSPVYRAAMTDNGSGHLHPLKLLLGEARAAASAGAKIFENSPVTAIHEGPRPRLQTPSGEVNCRYVVMACNAYQTPSLIDEIHSRILPAASFVVVTEPLGEIRACQLMPTNSAVADLRLALDYYHRTEDHRLLFGGRCHYTGRQPPNLKALMIQDMIRVFPQLADVKLEFSWGGSLGIGANRLPQIGRLRRSPNIFYAQAYAGHGINVTHLAGRVIAEALRGQAENFDLFDRISHKRFPGGRLLRSPLLALGMLYYRIRELL